MTYPDLKEECQNIYTELSYNSRMVRISMFHLMGRLLLENNEVVEGKLDKLAYAIGIDPYDLGTAILLAQRYPNLDDFPHDKTISFSQIRGILDAQTKET